MLNLTLHDRAVEAAANIRIQIGPKTPKIAFVLGSALGGFADRCQNAVSVDFADVPYVKEPTTIGHAGRFLVGDIAGTEVLVVSGRLHSYEGHSLEDVTFPVRVVAALGVPSIVLTNASGGLDPTFRVGDLMLIEDHINLTGENPLRGPNDERLGPRFPDMTNAYDPALRSLFAEVAADEGIDLKRGVYVGVSGPCYETPAEIRMFQMLGGHAVGMSTVPEAIVARHSGLRLAGISCITNAAAGITGTPLSHDEVMVAAKQYADAFAGLLEGVCRKISNQS